MNMQSAREHEHLAARAGGARGGRRPERGRATIARPARAPREREQLAAPRAARLLARLPAAIRLSRRCASTKLLFRHVLYVECAGGIV